MIQFLFLPIATSVFLCCVTDGVKAPHLPQVYFLFNSNLPCLPLIGPPLLASLRFAWPPSSVFCLHLFPWDIVGFPFTHDGTPNHPNAAIARCALQEICKGKLLSNVHILEMISSSVRRSYDSKKRATDLVASAAIRARHYVNKKCHDFGPCAGLKEFHLWARICQLNFS
jgi:hypothetical protein